MSMSDCPMCWDTPCCCGHGWDVYLRWRNEDILKLSRYLDKELTKRIDELLAETTDKEEPE